jgi:hypothetical protein
MTDLPDDLLLPARAPINQVAAEAAAQGKHNIRALMIYPAEEITPKRSAQRSTRCGEARAAY